MSHRRWNSNRFWWWTGTMIAALALWAWVLAGVALLFGAPLFGVGWLLITGSFVLSHLEDRPHGPTQAEYRSWP